jgi:hypothetical protein
MSSHEFAVAKILATVLFVRDLDRCTALYQDSFTLRYQDSDADSASFALPDGGLDLAFARRSGRPARSQASALQ